MRIVDPGENGVALLVAVGAVLLLLFWRPILLVGLVVGLAVLLAKAIEAQRLARLRGLIRRAEQRFGGDGCRCGDHFARLESIRVEAAGEAPQLRLALARVGGEGEELELVREVRLLSPPADLGSLASNLGFSRWLESQGITMLSDLAVEAKATQSSLHCLEEAQWAEDSLATMAELIASAETTRAKARGNELLEPAIPQLEQALATFRAEGARLEEHRQQARRQLRKLHDFLSVPATLRPILRFDLDGLFDPQRLQALKDSFAEVVTLHTTFTALSRQGLEAERGASSCL